MTAGFEIGDVTAENLRDEHGNALGGIRMPEMDVPVATYRGSAEGADLMSSLIGEMTPFTPEQPPPTCSLAKNRGAGIGA